MSQPQHLGACRCEYGVYLRQMGQAIGWMQCTSCGRMLHEQLADGEERYPLPDALQSRLREGWHMRHGGGVSRKTWLIIGHGLEPYGHKSCGYDWDYQEAQNLAGARRMTQRYLERGAQRVEIWETGADGLSALYEHERAAWALSFGEQRRVRPSALAERLAA